MAGKPGRETLAQGLAAGLTQTAAAERAGISTRTARRWGADPDFRGRVRELRAELLERAAGTLADSATEAVETLRKLLTSESDQVRLGAARAVLEHSIRVREATDWEQRLAELEAHVAAEPDPNAGARSRMRAL